MLLPEIPSKNWEARHHCFLLFPLINLFCQMLEGTNTVLGNAKPTKTIRTWTTFLG